VATPVDHLGPGDHACLTYTDPVERRDILAAFVAEGRSRGEKVIAYTGSDRLWDEGRGPDAKAMVERLAAELDTAEREGHPGLRITSDTCWAARPQANAEQLLAFESEVGRLFADGRLTAICEYDRESFDPVTLAYAARVHPRTVAATAYHDDPVLRICRQHVPPGVRVAGELDYRHADALNDALAEAVRLDHDVHLNLSHLRFVDAGAAAVILRVAADLPVGRSMVVVCSEAIGRTLNVSGAREVENLRLLVRDARG
jgi:anti-anti-sigma factor